MSGLPGEDPDDPLHPERIKQVRNYIAAGMSCGLGKYEWETIHALLAMAVASTGEKPCTIDHYYMQDTRSHVGNSMMWWAHEGKGYTCDIRKAMVFSREAAIEQNKMRPTDRPWPKPYIDDRISHHIDMQHCDYSNVEKPI